mmetsp:Transcript_8768/g.15815  ORF Transcript_8768/g.15815 Transcript_8768/m.15815 type:complete len:323 (+) Transcript_8768:76-1044(+)
MSEKMGSEDASKKARDAGAGGSLGTTSKFVTAGLGGIFGWLVIHPFNTVAIRMNLSAASLQANGASASATQTSFLGFTRNVVQNEGIKALYNGLSAGVLRQVFYATSRFGLFEVFRDQMAKYRETDFISRLTVGVASGAAAAFISCPAEVSLVRMSNDNGLPAAQRRNYTSVMNAAVRITREEGVSAFWRGSSPFMMRAMLVGATQVGTYDQFRQTFAKFGLPREGFPNVFAASMSAGLLYSLITMPFETAKNRMSSQQRNPETGKLPYTGTLQTIKSVASSEGTLALWKGFTPYYGRCGGHTVTMFVFVEQLRALYLKFIA